MKAHQPSTLDSWLAEYEADLERYGVDPFDDELAERARAEAAYDRAFDHTPAPAWSTP